MSDDLSIIEAQTVRTVARREYHVAMLDMLNPTPEQRTRLDVLLDQLILAFERTDSTIIDRVTAIVGREQLLREQLTARVYALEQMNERSGQP